MSAFPPNHIDPEDNWIAGTALTILWKFRTERYTIALFAVPEDMSPEGNFSDPRDVEFAMQGWIGIEPAHWFCAAIAVYDEDGKRIGADYLGGCSYASFEEFYSAHRWQYSRRQRKWIKDPRTRAWKACEALRPRRADGSRMDGHYFPDMVRQAIEDARATLGRQRDGVDYRLQRRRAQRT